jgi:hypothetical protein
VTVTRDLPGFGRNVRATIARGILAFLGHDREMIISTMSGAAAASGA